MTPAHATLWNRGGGLIYDDVLDVTWLQDANYAQTIGYNSDGKMTWTEAVAFANSLSYYDPIRDVTWSDWRLPTTPGVIGGPANQGELGHLYFDDGITPATPAPFINLQAAKYWTGTLYSLDPNQAWGFDFVVGGPCIGSTDERTTIPVFIHYHDVKSGRTTPEPSSFFLIGTGIALLVAMDKRRDGNKY